MVDNPQWEICERVAEVQALLDDHLAGRKHTAADVVAKAQARSSSSRITCCACFAMVERPRRSRALVGRSEFALAIGNGPQSFSLTAANKRTIPGFFTPASQTLSVG
jgi:hypothetical protein